MTLNITKLLADGQNNMLTYDSQERLTANSTYKKLAVQWLNEALCFVSSVVLADSFVLRNRQLLVAANRYVQP
jgi:YD repeat-containing protein